MDCRVQLWEAKESLVVEEKRVEKEKRVMGEKNSVEINGNQKKQEDKFIYINFIYINNTR